MFGAVMQNHKFMILEKCKDIHKLGPPRYHPHDQHRLHDEPPM